MKQKPEILSEEAKITISDEQVDVLIKDYQDKIQTTIAQAEGNPYIMGGSAMPLNGVAIDFAA